MMEKYILISNYANDNVVYAFSSDLEEVQENLNQDLLKFFEWSYENYTIQNPKSRQMSLYIPWEKYHKRLLQHCEEELKANKLETVLGKEIDSKLGSKLSS